MVCCRTGTRRLVGDRWEDRYHVITWSVEDTEDEARRVAAALRAGDPLRKEAREIWVERQERK